MTKKTIRVGLIGHQFMGVAHSNGYRNAGIWYDLPVNIEMKCLCAKDSEENLRKFADKFGWQEIETDWRKLVARDDIDLISVASPGFLHRDMAIEACNAGKNVLCEKPLANTLADAEAMWEAAKKNGVISACGFSYRFTPATALAKRLVDEGRLGEIYHVHARYAQDWDEKGPMVWRYKKELAGSGALGDLCSHSIDLSRFITGGEIVSLVSQLKTFVKKRHMTSDPNSPIDDVTVDDAAQFVCEFDNGAIGNFEATRLAGGRKNHNCIEINGSKGSVYWDFEDQNYLWFCDKTQDRQIQGFEKINATGDWHPYGGGPWPQGHGIGYADTFVLEIANLVTAIAEGRPHNPSFEDGVKCQRVLDAIDRSFTERKWVNV